MLFTRIIALAALSAFVLALTVQGAHGHVSAKQTGTHQLERAEVQGSHEHCALCDLAIELAPQTDRHAVFSLPPLAPDVHAGYQGQPFDPALQGPSGRGPPQR